MADKRQAQNAKETATAYVYLGDRLTDPDLVMKVCRPVRRADGKCVCGRSAQLVRFGDGTERVVLRRRLRRLDEWIAAQGKRGP